MTSIEDLLASILAATYGRDVRGAIHDAIEQCYDDISTSKTIADDSAEAASSAALQANSAASRAETAADDVERLWLAQNGIFPANNLMSLYYDEGSGFANVWAWIKNRIQNGNFTGIHVGDFIGVTCSNGFSFNARVAGINTYKRSGSSSVPNHIDFISDVGWPTLIKMNPANSNNGLTGRSVPFMASNAYYYLNSEAGNVPNSASDSSVSTAVDYTSDGVYYYLPSELKSVIVSKRVNATGRFRSNEMVTSGTTSSSIQLGKLWLPFEPEVIGCSSIGNIRDAACGLMRYPLFVSWPNISIGRESSDIYWLASAAEGNSTGFVVVRRYGDLAIRNATEDSKVPICFRVA